MLGRRVCWPFTPSTEATIETPKYTRKEQQPRRNPREYQEIPALARTHPDVVAILVDDVASLDSNSSRDRTRDSQDYKCKPVEDHIDKCRQSSLEEE